MKKFLNLAAKAWAKATLNIQKFANAYVDAVSEFGDEAVERFAVAFPMFGEREWRRLTLIGNGELLPQFFFKSDYFVGRLLKLNNSIMIQNALVGASNDGRMRVDRGNGPEKVALADLTAKEDKALVMLLSEENEKLSPEELKRKFRTLVTKINKSNRRSNPSWEIRLVGGRTVAHFNMACTMEREDIEEVLKRMKSAHCGIGAKRPSRDILYELSKKVVELEELRDSEWDFADKNGHDQLFWSDGADKEHDEILANIQKCRDEVSRLVREATGDDTISV